MDSIAQQNHNVSRIKKILSFFKKSSKLHTRGPKSQNIEFLQAQVSALLLQQDITRSNGEIKKYLQLLDNDVYETTQQLICLSLAEVGILIEIDNCKNIKGVENSSGTSCYIDTVLFSMYAQETAFDCLLHVRSLKIPGADALQTLCRFFVNLLRSNILIRGETVEQIRSQLIKCGWEAARNSQEDAAEFFLFLTGVLELPYLPLNVKLFHGGIEDQSVDDKYTADRILSLSLPPQELSMANTHHRSSTQSNISSKEVLHIENLLTDYFCSNQIQGIRRKIKNGTGSNFLEKSAITDAWSVLKLLPFYTSQNQIGNVSELRESDLTDSDLVLPLMIKRYTLNHESGEIVRDNRPVTLSTEINFNNFVKRLDDAVADRSQNEYRLQLKSVICHKGTSIQSGHYIAYVRDPINNDWLQLDDLRNVKVRRHNSLKSATKAFEIMSQNSYIALYKLTTGASPISLRSGTALSYDAKYARKVQIQDLSGPDGKSCNLQ